MYARFSNYVTVFLVSVSTVTAACSDNASPTAPAPRESPVVTAEPLTVDPEFLPNPFCPTRPPFGVRLTVIVRAGQDLIVRGMRFDFIDRSGDAQIPLVIPIPLNSSGPVTIPSSMPVPIPGSSPIPIPSSPPLPIPGFSPLDGVLVTGGSLRAPFFVQFGCDVPAAGTLFISVDTADRRGTANTSRVRVCVSACPQ
jgi:hypothetical protein